MMSGNYVSGSRRRKIPGICLLVFSLMFFLPLEALTVTVTGGSKLTASDGADNDAFGSRVAVSGSRTVVGAPLDDDDGSNSGSAYVFERGSDGRWAQTKLTASDGAAADRFGVGVAISGNRIIVGSPYISPNNESGSGSAYVFERSSDGTWSEVSKLTASDGTYGDKFGIRVSVSGDRAVVGAYWDNSRRGSAYIFDRTSSGAWTQTKLTASDGTAGDQFGGSVSVSGSRAVVGAALDDDDGSSSGSAYVFERGSDGTWTQTKLTASDGSAGDRFGIGVAISGNRIIVGAHTSDDDGVDSGSAYVFERSSDGTWSEVSKLRASDGAAGDKFGGSVAISGNRIAVGADHNDDDGHNSGSAYVFEKRGGTWSETTKFLAEDGAVGDEFGSSVGISGGVAFIGAPRDDTLVGSAYVYELSATTPPVPRQGSGPENPESGQEPGGVNEPETETEPSAPGSGPGAEPQPSGPGEEGPVARVSETVTLTGSSKLTAGDRAAGDWFGFSVSVSGARAIVGASVNAGESRKSGSVYVMEKGSDGAWSRTKLAASDIAFNDAFGGSVSISGARAIAGSAGDDDNGADSGSAYVFERGSDGAWSQTKLTAGDGAAGDQFGSSVSVSGARALVGAPRDDDNGADSGSAHMFERGSDGAWSRTKLTAGDGAAGDRFGSSVSVSGARAMVGAPLDDDDGSNSGSAYVFERGSDGAWSQTKLTPEDGAVNNRFGESVSISGDVAAAGAPRDDDNGTRAGAAYVFERASDGAWSEVSKLTASDGAAEDTFGESVAVSGNRIMVGGQLNDDNGVNSGAAYVFERNSDGAWSETTKLLAEDGAAGDEFGSSVGISDGVAFIGAVGDDSAAGSAYVYEFSRRAEADPGLNPESGRERGGVNEPSRNPQVQDLQTPGETQSLGEDGGGELSSGGGGCAVSGTSRGPVGAVAAALAPLMLIPLLTCGFRRKERVGD